MINCFTNIIVLFLFNINPSIEFQICLKDENGIEHTWIYGDDVLSYDWDNHMIYIIYDSLKAVMSRSVPCSGFSVKLGDTILYSGTTDISYNSAIGNNEPTILVWTDGLPLIDLKCACFKIYYFGDNEDRRSDMLLYAFLKREKKMNRIP